LAWAEQRNSTVATFVVPMLILALDMTLRWGLDLSVNDAGPDMALVATAGFFGMLAAEHPQRGLSRSVVLALTLACATVWVFTLVILARWGIISIGFGVPVLGFYAWVLSELSLNTEETGGYLA
jgi:hypothetical protein